MKIFAQLLVAAVAPVLLVAPVLGQEKKAPKTEKVAEKKKPTLTFYYFDG